MMIKKGHFIPYLFVYLFVLISKNDVSAETEISLDNGLRLSSADGQHKFHLGGYLLFDAILQDDNASQPQRFDLFNAWKYKWL